MKKGKFKAKETSFVLEKTALGAAAAAAAEIFI
jgi:hypothetical protein